MKGLKGTYADDYLNVGTDKLEELTEIALSKFGSKEKI